MDIQDHIGIFFALLLAAIMAYELRRCISIRRAWGEEAYPARQLRLRLTAFALLELALLSYALPGWLNVTSPIWHLASLSTGLILALLALIPLLRDWRNIRGQIAHDSDTLAQMAAEDLKRAYERELRRLDSAEQEEEKQQ